VYMRILVIEDEEKLARSIKKGLEHHGYAVDVVFDGGQGWRKLELNHTEYDIVITDIMLPTMDGLAICKALRDNNITIPVLMLTAKDSLENKIEGLNIGADDYMIKPFDFPELVARVNALLRRPIQTVLVDLCVRDVIMHTAAKKVTRGGTEILLTGKEYSVLEQFMRHPDQLLSRKQIMDHVWDFEFDGLSNVVDVHVKNLRKKLQKKGAKFLETVHGSGYRLNT